MNIWTLILACLGAAFLYLLCTRPAHAADCENPYVFQGKLNEFRWSPAPGPVNRYRPKIVPACDGKLDALVICAHGKPDADGEVEVKCSVQSYPLMIPEPGRDGSF